MIDDLASLREKYPQPKGRSVSKQLAELERHCRRFIQLSPFVVIASGTTEGHFDASPRGGEPGFVKVADAKTLLIPDSPGNNRLDTLHNILAAKKVGLLFLIPGVDETLRVNGAARLADDAATLAHFAGSARAPKLAIEVTVAEAYLHCAKAFMRSRLWEPESRIERSQLPTMSEMIRDQTGIETAAETQEEMRRRYVKDL
jgi:PPOX class probable FMN-dependent enzyme